MKRQAITKIKHWRVLAAEDDQTLVHLVDPVKKGLTLCGKKVKILYIMGSLDYSAEHCSECYSKAPSGQGARVGWITK
jgi:hypothetical protein